MAVSVPLNASLLNKLLFFILVLSIGTSADAQSDKRDYIWLFQNNGEPYGFDFNQRGPDVIWDIPFDDLPFEITGNNASICDEEGNLLYYTNGCHVVGADHQILPNGSGLNPGEFLTIYREDTCTFYGGLQDLFFLPDPADEDNTYLIHKTIGVDGNSLFMDNLKYTYIDGSLNNDIGDVSIKNNDILESGTRLLASNLCAISKSGEAGWWVTAIDEQNKIHVVDISETGIQLSHSQDSATNFISKSSGSGIAKFSPDGTSYAFYNPYDDLNLYDFDRETGKLGDLRQMILEEFPDDITRFSSIEWSPDSRFIYLAMEKELWQVDTWEDNLRDGLVLIDEWNGVVDPFWTTFSVMNLAPDCKIYMCSHSSTSTYHVINNPNAKGKDCDFVQQGIRLPHVSASATMPNFPRYRVDEEDKCDPTITSIFGEDIFWRRDLTCYPNPVRGQLTIELPEQKKGQLVVVDMEGNILMHEEVPEGSQKMVLSMSVLSSGAYSVEFIPDKNRERRIWTSRVVKIE